VARITISHFLQWILTKIETVICIILCDIIGILEEAFGYVLGEGKSWIVVITAVSFYIGKHIWNRKLKIVEIKKIEEEARERRLKNDREEQEIRKLKHENDILEGK